MAVTTAAMNHRTTQSFGECVSERHRKMTMAVGSELRARYAFGRKDYLLGGQPVWQILRCAFAIAKKPYLVGGAQFPSAYFHAWLTREGRAVSSELMAFHRREQLTGLRDLVSRRSLRRREHGFAQSEHPRAAG